MPRSPIAELIEAGYEPWLGGREVHRVLDLCTGSGCIGIATAVYQPNWQVDLVDLSEDALALANENIERFQVGERVEAIQSDLFGGLQGRRWARYRCHVGLSDHSGTIYAGLDSSSNRDRSTRSSRDHESGDARAGRAGECDRR